MSSICIILSIFHICCNRVQHNIRQLMGQTVNLPHKSMICWQNTAQASNEIGTCLKSYKYVIYIDSSLCSSCNINQLSLWNDLMVKMPNTSFIFIIAPHHIEDVKYICYCIENTDLKSPVYIDSDYQFLKCNPFFPKESLYHTVLLNNENEVILVGNPLRNPALENIAVSITKM